MAVESVINTSAGVITVIGQIGLWIKAAGIFIILWIIFQSIIVWMNFRRLREVGKIMGDMKRMEGKLDRLLKGKK